MEPLIWLIILLPFLVTGLIFLLIFHAVKKRRQAMQALAGELGFSYVAVNSSLHDAHGMFKLFARGHSRKSENVLTGSVGDSPVTLCDYEYSTGSGKNRSTYRQTICLVTRPGSGLPHFFLRRELPVFDRIGKWFGGQDINFDEDPDFSKAFVLQGMDEPAVRRFFRHDVREFFSQYRQERIQVEAFGDTFVLHFSRQLKPEQVRWFLDITGDFIRMFFHR